MDFNLDAAKSDTIKAKHFLSKGGRFRALLLLGRGEHGEVRSFEDCAVKVIRGSDSDRDAKILMKRSEDGIKQGLKFAPVLDTGFFDNLYTFSPRLYGVQLSDWFRVCQTPLKLLEELTTVMDIGKEGIASFFEESIKLHEIGIRPDFIRRSNLIITKNQESKKQSISVVDFHDCREIRELDPWKKQVILEEATEMLLGDTLFAGNAHMDEKTDEVYRKLLEDVREVLTQIQHNSYALRRVDYMEGRDYLKGND
ncbi:MAG: hypothetical protein FWE31_01410 [Firmicutes bacterium]|nr:hypothetical protein [Bacillota bacterium]